METIEISKKIETNNLQIKKKIGIGKSCDVYQCLLNETIEILEENSDQYNENACLNQDENLLQDTCPIPCSQSYALKVFKTNYSSSQDYKREIAFYEYFLDYPHKNLTQMKISNPLIIEFMENGDLFTFVQTSKKFAENLARYYFKQLVDCLDHIFQHDFIHRDIKLENILLDDVKILVKKFEILDNFLENLTKNNFQDFNIKLTDFGFAVQNVGNHPLKEFMGTQGYFSPQIASKQSYNGQKNDIFSLGVVLFIMITGVPPFLRNSIVQDPYYKQNLDLITYAQFFVFDQKEVYWSKIKQVLKRNFSEDFIELINNMLELDQDLRYSIEEVKKSKWFNDNEVITDDERLLYMKNLQKLIPEQEL